MSKVSSLWLALVAVFVLGTALAAPGAHAANIPMYDGNTARTRMVTDPGLSPTQLYLSVPTYLPLPGQSLSTPTVVGNTLYQYTYNGARGTLYAVNLPQIDGASVLRQYNYDLPGFLTRSVQYAKPPLVFSPSEGSYGADAQDSLTTAEGWQAIAVGQHLYAWPVGQWPTLQTAIPVHARIPSVRGNHRYQVDMNPLITPPVKVKVFNTQTGQNQTVQAPMAVACSWDGGCAAYPLVPSYLDPMSWFSYKTTQDFPSDTQAAITSDPVFIPHEPLFNNDPAVAFGVASWSHPRVELLDLVTGRAKAIGTSGAGRITAAIADAGMLATTSSGQYLVYHDEYGDVYSFNLDGAPSAGPISSGSSTIQLAEDGSQTSPQYPGTSGSIMQPVLEQNELLFAALPKTGESSFGFRQFAGASSPSTVYGSSVPPDLCSDSQNPDTCRYITAWSFSSSSVTDPTARSVTGPGIELDPQFGVGPGQTTSPGTYPYGNDGQFIAVNVSPYVGPVLDAGPEHYVMSWTNSTPQGSGAIVLYAPVNYGVAASGPSSVASGGSGTILVKPVPSGVTHDRIPGADGDVCNITGSPMTLDLSSSIGKLDTISMVRTTAPTVASPWSVWSGAFKLPANTTGASVKWTGTITAVDKYCTTAKATVTITELSSSSSSASAPSNPSGPSGPSGPTSPVTGTVGGNIVLDPNPALYGQQVTATLTSDTPSTPKVSSGDKLLSWIWRIDASPTLSYPLKPSTWAFGFPVVATQAKTVPMTVSGDGHSATARFMENWWDGGCQTLSGQCVWITNGFWMTGQGGPQYIPAHDWPVTASYTITENYSYEYPVITWSVNPACQSESPPLDCNTKGKTPTTTWDTKQASTTLPASGASASLNTDGTAIDSVGGG